MGLREGGFSYRAIGARVQRNSSTVIRVWKQWTDEHPTTRKTGSVQWEVTSARYDRHLLRRASSTQLAAHWSTATDVLMSASSIRRRLLNRGLRSRVPLYRIPLMANHRRLQWAHERRAWQADCTLLFFQMNHSSICGTMRAPFELDAMPVNVSFQSALSNDIVV
ncbi:transposable element Tcb2 transposase [Trichonephila clavipes]|uniref:Transposable element Tcb2 transposase n=1 Tax=Trichonephila clavipes TaxID=2585209 RepID=A0A8X6SHW1_TRICX|nr:transposable element Tcb2 transposase [Trichonephila clavipes]